MADPTMRIECFPDKVSVYGSMPVSDMAAITVLAANRRATLCSHSTGPGHVMDIVRGEEPAEDVYMGDPLLPRELRREWTAEDLFELDYGQMEQLAAYLNDKAVGRG